MTLPFCRYIHKPHQQRHDPTAAHEAPAGREEEERSQKRLQNTVIGIHLPSSQSCQILCKTVALIPKMQVL